jgi:hypothetical protein
MTEINPEAVSMLKQQRHDLEDLPNSAILRIEADDEPTRAGISLVWTTFGPESEDELIHEDADIAIYLAPNIAPALEQVTIEGQESEHGPALYLNQKDLPPESST